jgi:hypothetical protein
MGQPVFTKLGYCVDDDLMELIVSTSMGHNYHNVSSRWVMKENLYVDGVLVAQKGELMREDAAPSMLAGPGQRAIGGKLNG